MNGRPGEKNLFGPAVPLFLLELDGVSRTAGQGRGVGGVGGWICFLLSSFAILCMYAHMIGEAFSELERLLVYLS